MCAMHLSLSDTRVRGVNNGYGVMLLDQFVIDIWHVGPASNKSCHMLKPSV